jgi:hypothetical protein
MTEINDVVRGGWDPLQHLDPQAELHERYVRMAVRSDGKDQFGGHKYVKGTAGDLIGGMLWTYAGQPPPLAVEPASLRNRENPAWSFAYPVVVLSAEGGESSASEDGSGGESPGGGSSGGGEVAKFTVGADASIPTFDTIPRTQERTSSGGAPGGGPKAASGRVSLLPIVEPIGDPDLRFSPMIAEAPPGMAAGRRGVLLAATNELGQKPVFLPAAEPLVAVNHDGNPARASLVFDLGEDGKPDPERFARLQSMMRVVRAKAGSSLAKNVQLDHPGSHLLAWQLATGGRDNLAGFGLVADKPIRGVAADIADFQAELGQSMKGSPLAGPRGGSIPLGFGSVNKGRRSGTNTLGLDLDFDLAGAVNIRGPTDAMPFNDAQKALWEARGLGYDVELEQVTRNDNPFRTGAFTDLNLYKVVYKSEVPTFTQDKSAKKSAPKPIVRLAVGCMSRHAGGPVNAGGPGCVHKLATGLDGEEFYSAHLDVETYFRSYRYDGPLTFEDYLDRDPPDLPLRVKAHIVWNPSLDHDHPTGTKKGRWVIVSDAMEYLSPIQDQTVGRVLGDGGGGGGGGGGGVGPVCDPPGKTQKFYRASPFSQVLPGLYLKAMDFTPGAPDTRSVSGLTTDQLRRLDEAPVVAQIASFGNHQGGDWVRSAEETSFAGGVSDGGIYVGPPNVDLKDIINTPDDPPATVTTTRWVYHPDVPVGYGTPTPAGGVTEFGKFVHTPHDTPAGYVPESDGGGGATWVPAGSGTSADLIFGDGSDGTVTLGANTTISAPKKYANVTLAGYKLHTDGYLVQVSGTLNASTANSQVHNGGADATVWGGAGAALTTGTAGPPPRMVGGGGDGGLAAGVTTGGGGLAQNSTAGESLNTLGGGSGGAGGGAGLVRPGSAAGVATDFDWGPTHILDWLLMRLFSAGSTSGTAGGYYSAWGGAGGGGGGADNFTNAFGGDGGAGGGTCVVAARTITGVAGTATVASVGGNGAGYVDGGGGGGLGGGGGGGGGVAVAIFETATDLSFDCSGGTGGAGTGGGANNGANGSDGTGYEINLTEGTITEH